MTKNQARSKGRLVSCQLLVSYVFSVDGLGLRDVLGPSDDGTAVGEQGDFIPLDSNSHHVLIEIDLTTPVQALGEALEIRMGFLLGRDLYRISSAQAGHLRLFFAFQKAKLVLLATRTLLTVCPLGSQGLPCPIPYVGL
jgi:hypothetical protein